jgi:RNA polymerase sigma-70 factor (ECF subfamily)
MRWENADFLYWNGRRVRDNKEERSFREITKRPMIEDELLKLRFKLGSEDALRRIYEKYLNYLLGVAMAFLNDAQASEDIVHDVFVSLAQSAGNFRLHGSLKHYLAICVANRARDRLRAGKRHVARSAGDAGPEPQAEPPEDRLICAERAYWVYEALARLPDEQREVIALRITAGMKFRKIAEIQNASYVAVQARYRRGIDKLRSILDGGL